MKPPVNAGLTHLLLDTAVRRPHQQAPSRLGWWVLGLGLGAFLAWASWAPLANGVAIPGVVSVRGERQAVDSLDGGVIAALRVHEGQRVSAGQILVALDTTRSQSQVEDLRSQLASALAQQARLLAERDGTPLLTPASPFPDLDLATPMALQQRLFESRRQALDSELMALRLQGQGRQAISESLAASYQDEQDQRKLLQTQLARISSLSDGGYVPRNRLLALQRNRAHLDGELAGLRGRMQQARATRAELNWQRQARLAAFQQQVRSDLVVGQARIKQLGAQLTAADYSLRHTLIRSPATGVAMGLDIHTIGGVVKAGERLMEVVPSAAPLIVEAHLPTNKIDKIRSGLPVELMFTAFDRSRTPALHGKVLTVSPDRFEKDQRESAFYRLDVSVSAHQLARLGPRLALRAGMPVQVFVRTGQRSLLSYLFKPLFDRMHLAWGDA